MRNLLALVLVLFLFGCVHRPNRGIDKNIPTPTVYLAPAGDKIVSLEAYYEFYLNTIKTNYANRYETYEAQVQDSIFDKYFTNSEYAQLVKSRLSSPIRDTSGLRKYVSDITANKAQIEKLAVSTLAECRKYLKNDSITIYILPCNSDVEKVVTGKGGVEGLTAGSKQILIIVNPGVNGWENMLSYTIAREFDHTCWTKMNFNKSYQPTLLDCLISEGRADSYAHLVYPNTAASWTTVMPEKSVYEYWDRIKSQLKNTDVAYQDEVMVGSKSEYILWGGFTLGYRIVQSAIKKHPQLTPMEWNNLTPEKILEMSDYK